MVCRKPKQIVDGRAQSYSAAIIAREPADQSVLRLVGGRQESIASRTHAPTARQTDPLGFGSRFAVQSRSVSQLTTSLRSCRVYCAWFDRPAVYCCCCGAAATTKPFYLVLVIVIAVMLLCAG